MLFGRLVYGQAQAAQRIYRLLYEVVSELGLKSEVLSVGLDYGVGTGGRRLTQPQRQKVALVRALVRRPRILILNNALAPLESAAQTRLVAALRREMKDRCLILIADNMPAQDPDGATTYSKPSNAWTTCRAIVSAVSLSPEL